MLTRIYIEALLVDEELADQVWEAGDIGGDWRSGDCVSVVVDRGATHRREMSPLAESFQKGIQL